MNVIKLFGSLRQHSPVSQIEASGETVGAALESVCSENLELRSAIFEDRHLRPHVRVMVDGRDIELSAGLDTPLTAGQSIAIFPPIAGGSHRQWR